PDLVPAVLPRPRQLQPRRHAHRPLRPLTRSGPSRRCRTILTTGLANGHRYLSRPTLLVQAPHGARARVPGRVSFPLGADATTSGARCLRCRPTTSDGRRVSKHRAAFRGFDRDAMQFWHELASEMSREWYLANKQRYEDLWLGPMLNLVG